MAGHAVDELVEAVDLEEKPESTEANAILDKLAVKNQINSSYMPPPLPPVMQNAYKQVKMFSPRKMVILYNLFCSSRKGWKDIIVS